MNLKGKRVAVVGSREFDDKERLFRILTKNKDNIKLIVSGGSRGADTLAVEWATANGMPYLVFPALWHDPETGLFNRGAGFKRNWDIVEHSDVVLAFWDEKSRGTANTIDIAKQKNKPVKIFSFVPVKEEPPKESEKKAEASSEQPQKEQEQKPELSKEQVAVPVDSLLDSLREAKAAQGQVMSEATPSPKVSVELERETL